MTQVITDQAEEKRAELDQLVQFFDLLYRIDSRENPESYQLSDNSESDD